MSRPARTCSTLLTVSFLILLTGCSGESSPATGASTSTTPAPSASPSTSPSGSTETLPEGVALLSTVSDGTAITPGRYAAEFPRAARPDELPLALITVPSGYLTSGPSGVFVDEGGFRHIDLWTVSEVVEDPCSGPVYVDPGPSVQDLADALAALPVWESTKPKPVTVGGYDGLVMDFDVPDPVPARCGDEPYHWVDDGGGDQGVGPGKHQRLWIVDVEGERVMILAGWFPAGGSDAASGTTAAQVKELTAMAAGITFVRPGT
jgi:hypothetical protein